MADAGDSKTPVVIHLWVQVPPGLPTKRRKKISKSRWWISWYQPPDKSGVWDYRSIVWPLPETIIKYWLSGQTETHMTVCVLAEGSEKSVRSALKKCWPEFPGGGERFFEGKPSNWTPGDRFPMGGEN